MRDIIITSSILIAATLLVRRIVKGRIHPILQYSLWLPVVVKLLIPIPLWNSHISILNFFADSNNSVVSTTWQPVTFADENAVTADILHSDAVNDDSMSGAYISGDSAHAGIPEYTVEAVRTWSELWLPTLFMFIWFAGMTAVGGYMLTYQIRWQHYLRINRKEFKAPYNKIAEELGINLPVYIVNGLPSPCLSGRSIYLTDDMAADEKRLKHILAHEYCHYRHLDSVWIVIRCILTAVYWFNPLVWTAARTSKQDSEYACDSAVIRMLGENEKIDYAKTLIKLVSENISNTKRMGVVSEMNGSEKGIRERICKIAGKKKYIATTAGIVILLAAILTAATFSGAWKEDAESEGNVDSGNIVSQENDENAEYDADSLPTQSERNETAEIQRQEEEKMNQALKAAEEEVKTLQGETDLSQALKSEEIELPEGIREPNPWESAPMISYSNPCPSYTEISAGFGVRIHPITKEERVHNGVDMAAEKGADIVAAAYGAVYKTGYDTEYGNYVIIYHSMDNFTYYTCCDEIIVGEGELVESGMKIATVGSTGKSTGPHLHFMTSVNGEYVEPDFH